MEMKWTEKYRPKYLKDIVGNESVIQILKKLVETPEELPDILLSGKQGVGKTTIALAIVNEVLGKEGKEAIKRRTLVLNSSDDRGIDVARVDIKNFCRRLHKIGFVILDEVDSTTQDFQKALRKIMEDYPKAKFILTCNYPEKIIDPIKSSRCKWFKIKPLDTNSIINRLKYILEQESIKLDENIIKTIAVNSNGDLRKAINELYISTINNEYMEDILSIEPYLKRWFKFIAIGDLDNAIEFGEKMLENYSFETINSKFLELVVNSKKLSKNSKFKILEILAETEYRYKFGVSDLTSIIFIIVKIHNVLKKGDSK